MQKRDNLNFISFLVIHYKWALPISKGGLIYRGWIYLYIMRKSLLNHLPLIYISDHASLYDIWYMVDAALFIMKFTNLFIFKMDFCFTIF